MVYKQQRKTIITSYIQEQGTIAAVRITADTNKSVDTIYTDQWLLWIFTNLVTKILHLTKRYGIILWLTLAWYVQSRKVCEKFLALFSIGLQERSESDALFVMVIFANFFLVVIATLIFILLLQILWAWTVIKKRIKFEYYKTVWYTHSMCIPV